MLARSTFVSMSSGSRTTVSAYNSSSTGSDGKPLREVCVGEPLELVAGIELRGELGAIQRGPHVARRQLILAEEALESMGSVASPLTLARRWRK